MTSELDKVAAVHAQSQSIGEFLDWLRNEQHIELCEFKDDGNNGQQKYLDAPRPDRFTIKELDDLYGRGNWELARSQADGTPILRVRNHNYEYWPQGFYPINRSIQEWLALYFNIDLKKVEQEREQLLETIRAQQSRKER